MKYFATILFMLVSTAALCQKVNDETLALIEVKAHIKTFHHKSPQKIRNEALSFAPYVVEYSVMYDIDPLLVSIIIEQESSYMRNAIGKIGEEGLMQVHWRGAKKGFDMSKPEDQIHAGVKHLRHCFDICDQNLSCALTAYATGKKRVGYQGLNRRLRGYRKALATYRTYDTNKAESDE